MARFLLRHETKPFGSGNSNRSGPRNATERNAFSISPRPPPFFPLFSLFGHSSLFPAATKDQRTLSDKAYLNKSAADQWTERGGGDAGRARLAAARHRFAPFTRHCTIFHPPRCMMNGQ